MCINYYLMPIHTPGKLPNQIAGTAMLGLDTVMDINGWETGMVV